jgi:hypothetical protein
MKIFELENHEGGKVIRLILGMSLKNDALRRCWVMLVVLPMLAFNVVQTVVFGVPLFVFTMLRWLALSNEGLWKMVILRWNTPRDEQSAQQPSEKESDVSTFDKLREKAKKKGWVTPPTALNAFPDHSWVSYWEACEEYERNPNAGRPVPPHRSGHGVGLYGE